MRRIPLNIQTLYADLVQSTTFSEELHGSISRRTVKGATYLYVTEKHGAERRQVYLGPAEDAATIEKAEQLRRAAQDARQRRSTVSILKRSGLTGPTLETGRLLEALANVGLFRNGMVLVGTAAYQTYAPVVGFMLGGAALTTQDADLAAASLAVQSETDSANLLDILKRADPSFIAAPMLDRKALPKRFRSSSGFDVDIITRYRSREDNENGVPVPGLGCSAQPLRYLEFLMEDTIDVVALYNAGITVRVPQPARYAVHKLIIAQERQPANPKRRKDLMQAETLITALRESDPNTLEDAFSDARKRGPKWRAHIDASLAELAAIPESTKGT
ncbi:MAG: GSU2403 family nucleotidyltransferase fold protein [Beijerinckiaceae bacterium]